MILYLTIFSAISLAIIAAIFSITGLSIVFAAHSNNIIIMASVLEFSKIILTSVIFRYWYTINTFMKIYMVSALIILMIITSAGIFGYLSESYSKVKSEYNIIENEILLLKNKKELYFKEIERLNSRIENLNNIRKKQESRIDDLYLNQKINSARRIEENINRQENEISKLNFLINSYSDSLIQIENEINNKNSIIISGDLGPISYVADVFNTSIDNVVKYLIFCLIFVFDPLAIILIITANIIYLNKENERLEWTSIFNKKIKNNKENTEKNLNFEENKKKIEKNKLENKEIKNNNVLAKNKNDILKFKWKSSNWVD